MVAPPAELVPLLSALEAGLSYDAAAREGSLAQLKAWENAPGYYSSLVEIFANAQLELGQSGSFLRLQAVLQFKNGVDTHWRKAAPNPVDDAEKAAIRPRLLHLVNEGDRTIANAVAICIAKIARIDYGAGWDDLPASLVASIEYGASAHSAQHRLILQRSLLFLHKTIKTLSSNRMRRGRMLLETVCQTTFASLRSVYDAHLSAELHSLQAQGTPTEPIEGMTGMEIVRLAFKCLVKLMLYGFADPSQDEGARALFTASVSNFAHLAALRLGNKDLKLSADLPSSMTTNPFDQLTNHLAKYPKFYRQQLSGKPAAFLALGSTIEIVNTTWQVIEGASRNPAQIAEEPSAVYPERLVVTCMMLLKESMGDWAAASPINLPPGFATQYAELLITKLMPLREGDLEKWFEDAEEWMSAEEADRWEFDLRPCAEHVMQALIAQYPTELSPILAHLLEQASAVQSDSLEGTLLKEAVYAVLGKSATQLRAVIPFESWLSHKLIPEAAGTHANDCIIKRRIAWIVGDWIGELDENTNGGKQARVEIYRLLVSLIAHNDAHNDLGVQLVAARSLGRCDTWDFNEDDFLPFLPEAIKWLVALVNEVGQADSQMRLSKTLNVIIDRVGIRILPFAEELTNTLGSLWAGASQSHLQVSILVTFTALVNALDNNSQVLQGHGAHVIEQAVDPSSEAAIYLFDDGLELWHSLLKRSSSVQAEMVQLLPRLVHLCANGTDSLPKCLAILESYLLIDPNAVVSMCANELFAVFENLLAVLGELKVEAVKVILHALDLVLKTAPAQSWAQALDASNLIGRLTGPVIRHEQIQTVTKYLCSLARIVLAGPHEFIHLVQAFAQRNGVSVDELLGTIIDEWIERIDYMTQAGQRKLTALALASLIPTTDPRILGRLPDFVALWSGVLAQTEEDENGDAELYAADEYEDNVNYDLTDTLETGRKQELSKRDPVRSVRLATFIGTKLGEAQAANGGPEAFHATHLAPIDPLVLDELMKRLDGRLKG